MPLCSRVESFVVALEAVAQRHEVPAVLGLRSWRLTHDGHGEGRFWTFFCLAGLVVVSEAPLRTLVDASLSAELPSSCHAPEGEYHGWARHARYE